MTNKEWLATLPKDTWWDVVHEWLFHKYGIQWTDSRSAVMEWLEKEHEPIMDCDFREMEMSDKDKIVKGLSVCSEHGALAGEDCHGHYEYTDNLQEIIKANDYSWKCPYNGCKTGCVKTLAKDILALLKEPEAMEPKLGHAGEGYYICGNCRIAIFKHGTNYCHHCGKKIKWNTGGENGK